jgi:sulfur relay (sulfurtransferase) complex TusBCD TusD component (DsrE family)
VKVLVIVNQAPWGGTLGLTALRLSRAMAADGLQLAAVFFREEGVYQCQPGRTSDAGTPDLATAWAELARDCGAPLLLCSSASQRRLPSPPANDFREAGLAEVFELMGGCDRVVSF